LCDACLKKYCLWVKYRLTLLETGSSLLLTKPPSRLSPQNKRRPIALLFHSFPEGEILSLFGLNLFLTSLNFPFDASVSKKV
jgi:hypothetical protein